MMGILTAVYLEYEPSKSCFPHIMSDRQVDGHLVLLSSFAPNSLFLWTILQGQSILIALNNK